VHPHGKLGDLWEKYLQVEAEFHFQELSAVTSELISGRTMYCPKHEDMFIKLLRKDMSWFMMDMIWFNDKEEKRI